MEELGRFIKRNKWTIICIVIGIVFAMLIFSLGFWRTVLLGVIVAICFFIGASMDKNGGVGHIFKDND